ncbi:MAG: helix-turn-helix domain-containing protein [Pirellulaceae bacterium]
MSAAFNQTRKQVRGRSRGVKICGERLRQLRLRAGFTQAELATHAGYSERLIRKAEADGIVSIKTLSDLAEALSTELCQVQVADLCSSPLAIAKQFVEAYDRFGNAMLADCSHLLADGFVFHFAGDPQSPLSGTWHGRRGFQQWLDMLFSMASRSNCEVLRTTYLEADSRITAHYTDHFVSSDGTLYEMWVNLHFVIVAGLIARIDNESDSYVVAKLARSRPNIDSPYFG